MTVLVLLVAVLFRCCGGLPCRCRADLKERPDAAARRLHHPPTRPPAFGERLGEDICTLEAGGVGEPISACPAESSYSPVSLVPRRKRLQRIAAQGSVVPVQEREEVAGGPRALHR